MLQGLSNLHPPLAPAVHSSPPPTLPLPITILVPYDPVAEEVVIGCAVDTAEGARLAAHRVSPNDLYRPAFAAVIESLAEIDHVSDSVDRTAVLADRCGLPPLILTRLIAERPCLLDSAGSYASRVVHAAWRRRLVLAALAVAQTAAATSSQAEVRPALAHLTAVWSLAFCLNCLSAGLYSPLICRG